MFAARQSVVSRWGKNLLVGTMLIAVSCSQPGKGARAKSRTHKTETTQSQPEGNVISGQTAPDPDFQGTELWFFGVSDAKLTKPFDAKGVRLIVDLRTFKAAQSIAFLKTLADKDLGMAICIRWKNPHHGGERAMGRENFDVPPTSQESSRALDQLTQVLSSEPAKKMGNRLYLEVYNEIGGGPGRFDPKDSDAMFAFADKVVPVIRRANPNVRISGPAISGGQLAQYGTNLSGSQRAKADFIDQWVKWTAKNADVQDVHLNGLDVDPQWADQALTTMRHMLDQNGGKDVGLISLEWSCSGYSDRTNAAGIKKYIHGVWDTLNKHHVEVAAYTYWPLFERDEEFRDRTSWASVVGPDKKPNQAVWDTLVEIGKEK